MSKALAWFPLRCRRWRQSEIIDGHQVNQWFALLLGAMCTTVPAIILIPFLLALNMGLRIEYRSSGRVAMLPCGLMAFAAGIGVWILISWVAQ